jgi:hypothetical protein
MMTVTENSAREDGIGLENWDLGDDSEMDI